MCSDILIRPATINDLPKIRDILNYVINKYDYYLSNKLKTDKDLRIWFEEHLNRERYSIFTAYINDEMAGWVSLSPFRAIDGYNSTAELSIYVNPEYYRRGVADCLMNYIETVAINSGCLHCIISVITSNNEASIALHNKHGYKTEGVLKEIANKNGHYIDVVMMTKLI